MPEFLRLHGNLQTFNCQGLEKLNHLIKCSYFSNSNKHSNVYLRQLVEKRNREEFSELKGTFEEMEFIVREKRSRS